MNGAAEETRIDDLLIEILAELKLITIKLNALEQLGPAVQKLTGGPLGKLFGGR